MPKGKKKKKTANEISFEMIFMKNNKENIILIIMRENFSF